MKGPEAITSRGATALCFLLPLALYVATAARTIQGGDAGEFANLGFLGGVAHPPGYPVFALLLRAASHLPLHALFLRASMVSVLAAAAAVALLQRATFLLTADLTASLIAALAFALSREQWLMAGVPDVFALNGFFAALGLFFAARRQPLLVGLAGGLGMAHHMSIVWCFPIAVWAGWSAPRRGRAAGLIAVGGLIGLLPYALLPWMARSASPYGYVWADVTTWHGFVNHLLRREYGTFQLVHGSAAGFRWAPVAVYLRAALKSWSYLFFIVGMAGVFLALRRRMPWAIACVASFVLAAGVFLALMNEPLDAIGRGSQERFYVLPNLLFAPLVAIGLSAVFRWRPAFTKAGALVLLISAAVGTYPGVNWRADHFIERYFTAEVTGTPPGSVLIGSGDTEFSAVRWITHVLRVRPDLHFVAENFLNRPGYVKRMRRELPELPGAGTSLSAVALKVSKSRPTFSDWSCEPFFDRSVDLVQDGLLLRIAPPGTRDTPPAREEAILSKVDAQLGSDVTEPVDQQIGLVRIATVAAWRRLSAEYAAAGDDKSAERCLEHGLYWLPSTGVGLDWLRDHSRISR